MLRLLWITVAPSAACSALAARGADMPRLAYPVVDTGQDRCYDATREIAFPAAGQPFFGQDAQFRNRPMRFRDNGDGTVTDLNTELVWQKTPDFQMRSWQDSIAYARRLRLGGHGDWRVPSIKELFSIVDFRGNQHTHTPYLDTAAFDFKWPTPAPGVRSMDAQYWSSTPYLGTTMRGDTSVFGFNFVDGRIKAYPIAGAMVAHKFVRCVRGRAYGVNDFHDNGEGTVTDRATGLTWTRSDSGRGMSWQQALAWAAACNRRNYLGHDDWRVPDVKDLQSIVDYRRAPDARTASARGPAIDPVFQLTDPQSWFWTSTTHVENLGGYYVCFGEASSAMTVDGRKINAHGAGAVRSDPKAGNPRDWPNGLGPQRDEIRIDNYVRLVRGGPATLRTRGPALAPEKAGRPVRPGGGTPGSSGSRFVRRLDRNGDGRVSREEFDGPKHDFGRLDRNGDGYITEDEAPQGPPPRGPGGRRPPRKPGF